MGGKKNKTQRSKVIELNEHLTPVEIASRLGISRQRVYQILSDEGTDYLTLNKGHRRLRRISRNLARSLGPEVAYVNRNTKGSISELLAAADLLALGWHPYVPLLRNNGYDIVATKNDKIITIEVRSGRRREDATIATCRKKAAFPAHHFAFVMSDEPVVYEPPLPQVGQAAHGERISYGDTHAAATKTGLASARERGRVGGRRLMYSERQIEAAALRFRAGEALSVICRDVTSRAGKAITVTRLRARIAEFEKRKQQDA